MRKLTAAILGVVGSLFVGQGCAMETTEEDVSTVDEALTCADNAGLHPVKAALATNMAKEIGEIDALKYLEWKGGAPWSDANGKLGLSAAGETACQKSNGCPALKSVLALQDPAVNLVIPNYVLSVGTLKNDLYLSFSRQYYHVLDLKRNSPADVPEAHTLKLVGTVDKGACGMHFEFDAYKAGTTTPLSHPEDLIHNLDFFGISSGNTYLAFYATDGGIGIDPTVSLTGTVQKAGTCGSGFSIYDPSWYSYGKCCYYNGSYGTWAVASWAANTFYCKR